MTRQLENLGRIGIEAVPMPGLDRHVVFARDCYAALVERLGDGGLGRIGTAGKITGRGLAMLVWREGRAFFVLKNQEEAAAESDVAALRQFTADLERVLRAC